MPQQVSDRTVALAKKVLAKCMAYDPHFPNPSQATVMAWAEHISIRNLPEEDMLDAVTRFYEANTQGVKPLPASITSLALDVRRCRSAAETRASREQREARIDAKVEGREPVTQLPGSEKITLAEWERRHGVRFPKVALGLDVPDGPNPLSVSCPWCKQRPSYRCVIPGSETQLREGFHDARHAVLEGRCAASAGWHVSPHSEDCERR